MWLLHVSWTNRGERASGCQAQWVEGCAAEPLNSSAENAIGRAAHTLSLVDRYSTVQYSTVEGRKTPRSPMHMFTLPFRDWRLLR
eukprot:627901-Prorocentrum_minimum.AAC.1